MSECVWCVWCVWCVCVCVCVYDSGNPHIFLQVQSIESVQNDVNLEGKLWEREKYWQCQLFTNTHGMNSVSDLYLSKREGCRKN